MQSLAPASSLAEPPPAASPQLGRSICQQGLRSARIRGLLLVHAAASAAAAALTTTLAFFRLVTFRTGMITFLSGIQYNRIRRTWVLILPFVVFIVALCNAARDCGLACFGGLIILALLSHSIPVLTQIRGHIAGPPSPSPLRSVPSFLSREQSSISYNIPG